MDKATLRRSFDAIVSSVVGISPATRQGKINRVAENGIAIRGNNNVRRISPEDLKALLKDQFRKVQERKKTEERIIVEENGKEGEKTQPPEPVASDTGRTSPRPLVREEDERHSRTLPPESAESQGVVGGEMEPMLECVEESHPQSELIIGDEEVSSSQNTVDQDQTEQETVATGEDEHEETDQFLERSTGQEKTVDLERVAVFPADSTENAEDEEEEIEEMSPVQFNVDAELVLATLLSPEDDDDDIAVVLEIESAGPSDILSVQSGIGEAASSQTDLNTGVDINTAAQVADTGATANSISTTSAENGNSSSNCEGSSREHPVDDDEDQEEGNGVKRNKVGEKTGTENEAGEEESSAANELYQDATNTNNQVLPGVSSEFENGNAQNRRESEELECEESQPEQETPSEENEASHGQEERMPATENSYPVLSIPEPEEEEEVASGSMPAVVVTVANTTTVGSSVTSTNSSTSSEQNDSTTENNLPESASQTAAETAEATPTGNAVEAEDSESVAGDERPLILIRNDIYENDDEDNDSPVVPSEPSNDLSLSHIVLPPVAVTTQPSQIAHRPPVPSAVPRPPCPQVTLYPTSAPLTSQTQAQTSHRNTVPPVTVTSYPASITFYQNPVTSVVASNLSQAQITNATEEVRTVPHPVFNQSPIPPPASIPQETLSETTDNQLDRDLNTAITAIVKQAEDYLATTVKNLAASLTLPTAQKLNALKAAREKAYNLFETLDATKLALKIKHPDLPTDPNDKSKGLPMTAADPTVEVLVKYVEVLVEATMLSKRPNIKGQLCSVLVVFITRIIRILGYFMCEKREPQQGEALFQNIVMQIMMKPTFIAQYGRSSLSYLLVSFWQCIRGSIRGPPYTQGALMDHASMGPEKFRERLEKYKTSYENNKSAPAPNPQQQQQQPASNNPGPSRQSGANDDMSHVNPQIRMLLQQGLQQEYQDNRQQQSNSLQEFQQHANNTPPLIRFVSPQTSVQTSQPQQTTQCQQAGQMSFNAGQTVPTQRQSLPYQQQTQQQQRANIQGLQVNLAPQQAYFAPQQVAGQRASQNVTSQQQPPPRVQTLPCGMGGVRMPQQQQQAPQQVILVGNPFQQEPQQPQQLQNRHAYPQQRGLYQTQVMGQPQNQQQQMPQTYSNEPGPGHRQVPIQQLQQPQQQQVQQQQVRQPQQNVVTRNNSCDDNDCQVIEPCPPNIVISHQGRVLNEVPYIGGNAVFSPPTSNIQTVNAIIQPTPIQPQPANPPVRQTTSSTLQQLLSAQAANPSTQQTQQNGQYQVNRGNSQMLSLVSHPSYQRTSTVEHRPQATYQYAQQQPPSYQGHSQNLRVAGGAINPSQVRTVPVSGGFQQAPLRPSYSLVRPSSEADSFSTAYYRHLQSSLNSNSGGSVQMPIITSVMSQHPGVGGSHNNFATSTSSPRMTLNLTDNPQVNTVFYPDANGNAVASQQHQNNSSYGNNIY